MPVRRPPSASLLLGRKIEPPTSPKLFVFCVEFRTTFLFRLQANDRPLQASPASSLRCPSHLDTLGISRSSLRAASSPPCPAPPVRPAPAPASRDPYPLRPRHPRPRLPCSVTAARPSPSIPSFRSAARPVLRCRLSSSPLCGIFSVYAGLPSPEAGRARNRRAGSLQRVCVPVPLSVILTVHRFPDHTESSHELRLM